MISSVDYWVICSVCYARERVREREELHHLTPFAYLAIGQSTFYYMVQFSPNSRCRHDEYETDDGVMVRYREEVCVPPHLLVNFCNFFISTPQSFHIILKKKILLNTY